MIPTELLYILAGQPIGPPDQPDTPAWLYVLHRIATALETLAAAERCRALPWQAQPPDGKPGTAWAKGGEEP